MRIPWPGSQREDDLQAELESHLQMAKQDRIDRGESTEGAEHSSRREMGNIGLIKEATREMWGRRVFEQLVQDVRYGARMLLKSPGFTVVAILSLALGIGATTALFSIVYGVMLRPLPYPGDDRLAMVYMHFSPQNAEHGTLCIADYLDWKAGNHAFEDPQLYTSRTMNITGTQAPDQVTGALVTSGFFSALRVGPIAGRTFAAGEDTATSERVVVIGETLWRRRFSADPSAVGRTLELDGIPHVIIGVMSSSFRFPRENTELWTNLQVVPPNRRGPFFYRGLGRLNAGVSIEQAQAETNAIGRSIEKANPYYSHLTLPVLPLRDAIVGNVRLALMVIFGAVFLVLLIAAANIANLLLSRAVTREQEMAVRLSLGARRGRLIRQLLVESALLALAGGLVGIALASIGLSLLRQWNPGNLPRLQETHLDGHVLIFTLFVSLLSGLFFGLAPALLTSRANLSAALKQRGRTGVGGGHTGPHSVLAVVEVAVSMLLLIGAGLLLRSFAKLQEVDPGFRAPAQNVLTIAISPNTTKYGKADQGIAFYEQILDRVRVLPGVESVAISDTLPPNRLADDDTFVIEGQELGAGQTNPAVTDATISYDYFRALDIPLLRGRFFTVHDTADSPPVTIISDSLARQYFPGRDPIGHWLKASGPELTKLPHMEIVGVVGDAKYWGLDRTEGEAYYMPFSQAYGQNMWLVVRSAIAPENLITAIRQQIRAVDSDVVINQIATLEQDMSDSIARPRFHTGLIGLFAIAALLLAAIGVYGVISYSVSQRTNEFGIRAALGARPADVLRLILAKGAKMALIGVGIGTIAALGLTRLMADLLFGIRPTDPVTFLAVAMLLCGVALMACYLPARRAMHIDPNVALRYE
jgi:putative ABC transport system permease protein